MLLVISLIPYLISKTHRQQWLISAVLLVSVVVQNWFWLAGHLKYSIGGEYVDSVQVASSIDTDIRAQRYDLKRSTLIWFATSDAGKSHHELAQRWHTSSIQLALESIDPAYEQRVRVVPWATNWSNYVQPFQDLYYVVCESSINGGACTDEILWDQNIAVVQIGELVSSNHQTLIIYRVVTELRDLLDE